VGSSTATSGSGFLATRVRFLDVDLESYGRPAKGWKGSGNRISGGGQGQAPAALSVAMPACAWH
jgi:hypothetical protein